MSTFPNSPRQLKGGIVLMDADTGVVQRIIALQYNPETLTRSLAVQAVGGEGADRSPAVSGAQRIGEIEKSLSDAEVGGCV